jgi:hypothetical protein
VGTAKVAGGHPGRDGESPGLDARPPLKPRQCAGDLDEGFLDKIVGGGAVADQALQIPAQRIRQLLRHIFEYKARGFGTHGASKVATSRDLLREHITRRRQMRLKFGVEFQ